MNYLLFIFHTGGPFIQNRISDQITKYIGLISEEEVRFVEGEGNTIISFKSFLTKPQLISSLSEMAEGLEDMFDYILISKPRTFLTNIAQENIDFLFNNTKKRPTKNVITRIERELTDLRNLFDDIRIFENECNLTLDDLLDKMGQGGGIKSLTKSELKRLNELSNNLNNEG